MPPDDLLQLIAYFFMNETMSSVEQEMCILMQHLESSTQVFIVIRVSNFIVLSVALLFVSVWLFVLRLLAVVTVLKIFLGAFQSVYEFYENRSI